MVRPGIKGRMPRHLSLDNPFLITHYDLRESYHVRQEGGTADYKYVSETESAAVKL